MSPKSNVRDRSPATERATPAKKPRLAALSPTKTATPPSTFAGGGTPSSTCAEELFPDPGWPLDSEKAKLRAPQYMKNVIPFARQSFEHALKQNKKLQENLNMGVLAQQGWQLWKQKPLDAGKREGREVAGHKAARKKGTCLDTVEERGRY